MKIGLISDVQFSKLLHIYQMRCVYAHPYEESPTEEDVKAAIVTAVDSVLSQTVFLRHGYINHLIADLFSRPYYLDDAEGAVRRYARESSSRVLPDLHSYLIARVLAAVEEIVEDPDLALYRRRGKWFIAEYLEAVQEDLMGTDWGVMELITEYSRASSLVLTDLKTWPVLNEVCQDYLLGVALRPGEDDVDGDGEILENFCILDRSSLLSQREKERFLEKCNEISLTTLVNTTVPLDYYAATIIELLRTYN